MYNTALISQQRSRRMSGFSLTELMIAMLLGLFVVGGIGQIYVAGRDANNIIERTATINENGRFAMEFFARDTRMAGYFSCGGQKARVANAVEDGSFWLNLRGIEGFDGGDTTYSAETLPAAFDDFPAPLAGTDVFIIRYTDTRSMRVGSDDLETANNRFVFDQAHPFGIGDVAIVNDAACTQTSVFQVTGGTNSNGSHIISYDPDVADVLPGNCTNKLAGEYSCASENLSLTASDPSDDFDDARISRLVSRAFFIANAPDCTPTTKSCSALQNCPTLYAVGTESSTPVPVLRDVIDMEIEYGIDDDIELGDITSGDDSVDRYLTARDIDDDLWPKVISMRIMLALMPTSCKEAVQFTNTVALRNNGGAVFAE